MSRRPCSPRPTMPRAARVSRDDKAARDHVRPSRASEPLYGSAHEGRRCGESVGRAVLGSPRRGCRWVNSTARPRSHSARAPLQAREPQVFQWRDRMTEPFVPCAYPARPHSWWVGVVCVAGSGEGGGSGRSRMMCPEARLQRSAGGTPFAILPGRHPRCGPPTGCGPSTGSAGRGLSPASSAPGGIRESGGWECARWRGDMHLRGLEPNRRCVARRTVPFKCVLRSFLSNGAADLRSRVRACFT